MKLRDLKIKKKRMELTSIPLAQFLFYIFYHINLQLFVMQTKREK